MRAAADRCRELLDFATACACRDSACGEAAALLSRFSASSEALERFADELLRAGAPWPRA